MKVDVVILTKNSEYMLEKCLNSVYQNIPVDNLIVIDGFSVDRTVEILKGFNNEHGNIKIIQQKGTRAKARTIGIKAVETEWFMFVDSDVILCRNWYGLAQQCMGNGVGAIWGVNIDVIPTIKNRTFYAIVTSVAKDCFKLRGGMHDTLILHDIVRRIRIPRHLHVFEDAYIVNWIRKKGYEVVIGDNLYCLHYIGASRRNFKKSLDLLALEIECGFGQSQLYKYMMKYYPYFMFYWVVERISALLKGKS